MNVLHETYLDQMMEEMEIINFKLDRMFEAAVTSPENSESDEVSLLESISNEEITIDEEKYDAYTEALGQSLKAIWNAIVRFIKSVFTSSGEHISYADAKKIIEIIDSASGDGDINGAAMKKVAQKGFYMIVGLGTSVDGDRARKAYESGDILNFVVQNIKKVKLASIPEDSSFRVCIASYDGSAKVNGNLIKSVMEIVKDKGRKGVEELGEKNSKKFEGAEGDNPIPGSGFDPDDSQTHVPDAPPKPKRKRVTKQDVAEAHEKGKREGAAIGAAVVAGGVTITALASGVAHLVKKHKAGSSPENANLTMAVITYVNESKESAMAKVRLYTASGVKDINIQGREKVVFLRDELSAMAQDLGANGDKLSPGMREYVMEFATQINLFFASLADRKAKA